MPEKPFDPNARGIGRHSSMAGELSDAQIAVMRDAFDWISGGPDSVSATLDSVSAVMLLDLLADPHAHYLAMRLARALHTQQPVSVTRELTPLLSLAVAVAVINAGAVRSDLDPDRHDQLVQEITQIGHRIHGLYDTEAAATEAKRGLGDTPRIELAFQAGYLVVTPTSA